MTDREKLEKYFDNYEKNFPAMVAEQIKMQEQRREDLLSMAVLYQVDTGYACFGIAVRLITGEIISAAPIASWTIGKDWSEVEEYYLRRGFTIN